MRRVLVVLLTFGLTSAGAAEPGAGSGPGPLPGEIVTRIGQVAAIPADERLVPGYAGAWRMAAAQRQVLDSIKAHEARAARPCQDVHVTDSVQAAPDLLETRPRPVHHALEHWTVQACGAARQYEVWYRFEKDNSRVLVADSAGADFQAELDPPYRRLRELAAARRQELAAGGVRWLNLPLPADSVPASNESTPRHWSADFVPLGESIRDWTQLVAVQGLQRTKSKGQAVMLLEGMQRSRATRCGVPAGEVSLLPPGANAPHGVVAQTFLVCPRVPDTNYAELAVVKAIEGPDWLYVVQRAWRLPAGEAESVLAVAREPRLAAEAFLETVQLCNPTQDRQACPSPFPR